MTRDEWRETYLFCFACGKSSFSGAGLEIHEIACGPARKKALKEPSTWLRLCAECHRGKNGVHNYAVWPIARQLFLKKCHDPEHYDRVAANRLRGRADNAITEEEVDQWEERNND